MADIGAAQEPEESQSGLIQRVFRTCSLRWQHLLDRLTPYLTGRWIITAALFLAFTARIIFVQGWYVVAYALGVYLLSLFVLFLAPKIDPSNDEHGPSLPTRANEEYRPFMRRLPEFGFWLRGTRAITVALVCSFFDVFNVPVFWPILVMYFVMLFAMTMKRQIRHMMEFKYLPWSRGKARYAGKPDS